MILRQLYPDRAVCAPGVGGGRPGQNGLLGGGAVLDDHEHRVAERHDHVVNGIRVVGEDGRGQTGLALQTQHHSAAVISQSTALHGVEVGLTAHLAQGIENVAIGQSDLHLGHVPAGIKGLGFQSHADGGEAHFQGGEQAGLLGHVADRAEALAVCPPQGHAAEHPLALLLVDHEARHLGEPLTLLGGEVDLHGGRAVTKSQGAERLGGLEDEAACFVVLGQGPVIGDVGVVGLADLFVGVLGLDKIAGHGVLLSLSSV